MSDRDHAARAIRLLGTERWPDIVDGYTLGAYGTMAGYEGF